MRPRCQEYSGWAVGKELEIKILAMGEHSTWVQLASGLAFLEGPIWHPDGFLLFVEVKSIPPRLYKLVPGSQAEIVMETAEANGATFDVEGRLWLCEAGKRRVARLDSNGVVDAFVDRFEGGRFNRPNDIICRSDGVIYFTDPGLRVPFSERDLTYSGIYQRTPDGRVTLVADCEYPNGLALSPDERILYVANTRWTPYIHKFVLGKDGLVIRRSIFADMSPDPEMGAGIGVSSRGVPDGIKVDANGNVYCTGHGGIWVFDPTGRRSAIIPTPEVVTNLAFGGQDLRTLFITTYTSVYSLSLGIPGHPYPWLAMQSIPNYSQP